MLLNVWFHCTFEHISCAVIIINNKYTTATTTTTAAAANIIIITVQSQLCGLNEIMTYVRYNR
jgi:hypothetical protein